MIINHDIKKTRKVQVFNKEISWKNSLRHLMGSLLLSERQISWDISSNCVAFLKPWNPFTLWTSKVFTKTSDPCMTFSGLTLMPLVRENAWERDAHLQKSPKWGRKSMNIFIILLLNHYIFHFFSREEKLSLSPKILLYCLEIIFKN